MLINGRRKTIDSYLKKKKQTTYIIVYKRGRELKIEEEQLDFDGNDLERFFLLIVVRLKNTLDSALSLIALLYTIKVRFAFQYENSVRLGDFTFL